MNSRDEGVFEQMQERITNVLTVINTYRARNLGDMRLESFMTQLEEVQDAMAAGKWFTAQQMREFDFHQVEDTPLEGNEQLERELQAIRNFVENKL
ncbi:MAG: hypothetical protein V4480_01240 [Patescibacteria group bacterium]